MSGVTGNSIANNAGTSGSQNFNIPYLVPPDTPDNLKPYLQPIYSALQNIIQTLITTAGIAPRSPSQLLNSLDDPTAYLAANNHRFYTQAIENISFGAAISLYGIGSIIYVRNASAADNSKPPHGFCSQSSGLLSGDIGEVCLGDGMIVNALSNLSVGQIYYLSQVPGTYTLSPPSIVIPVGFAITTTSMLFRCFKGLSS